MPQTTPSPVGVGATPTLPLPHGTQTASETAGCPHLALITPFEEGEVQALAMENWFQACSSDEPFALELVGTRREQGFVLRATSEAQLSLLCKQLQAQYPQAELQRIAPEADPLLLHTGEYALVGDFALTKPSHYPLKWFPSKALTETSGDPVPNLFAAMELVGSGERIISQLSLVRAPDDWIAPALRKAVEHPLQEERDRATASTRGGGASDLGRGWRILLGMVGGLASLWGYQWYRERATVPLVLLVLALVVTLGSLVVWRIHKGQHEIYDMKLVSEKLMRSAYYMQLRVIAVGRVGSSHEDVLAQYLKAMEVAYRQYSLASANSLALKRVHLVGEGEKRARHLWSVTHAFAYWHPLLRALHRGWSPYICNCLELVGLYHLPQQFADLPLVKRLSVKHLLFSPEVSHAIEHQRDVLPPVLLGYSKHRSRAIKVLLPYKTQMAHKFLVGRSRYGKSVALQLLFAGILRRGQMGTLSPGAFVIDPHRDLVFDLLKMIPNHRANDVLLLDFTNATTIVGMNPLDATMGLSRDQMVSSLMNCFEKIWEKNWGPRMAYFLKNICLLLITLNFRLCAEGRADEQYTLLDINPILQYKDYATLVLNQLDSSETWHQELLAWFQHTYWSLPPNSSLRQEIILPILSKMATFTDNVQLRRIFGQPITTAQVHECITQGKIVLCALSSRDMDEASVNILGSTLINTLHYAFTRQQEVPLLQRRTCAVFVDELQNFSGSAFDKLLSEDAKWGCSALFTTQSLKRLSQIKEGLQEMLLSNCDNLFVFNVSAADAKILEAELQDKVSVKHILSQPRLHCYCRVVIPDHPIQFASLSLARPLSWDTSTASETHVDALVRQNQRAFLSASACDALHERHLKKFLDISLFADRVAKEAASIEDRRRTRAAEQQLAQDIARQQQSSPSSQTNAPSSSFDQTTPAQQGDGQGHAHPTPETVQPETTNAPPSKQSEAPKKGHKRTRSRRMRKLKKNPTGMPPPGLEQDSDERRALADTVNESRPFRDREGREQERDA